MVDFGRYVFVFGVVDLPSSMIYITHIQFIECSIIVRYSAFNFAFSFSFAKHSITHHKNIVSNILQGHLSCFVCILLNMQWCWMKSEGKKTQVKDIVYYHFGVFLPFQLNNKRSFIFSITSYLINSWCWASNRLC